MPSASGGRARRRLRVDRGRGPRPGSPVAAGVDGRRPGRAGPRAGHWAAAAGPIAAICCQARDPRLARRRVLGDGREHRLGRREDRRPLPFGERRVQRLDLGGGGLLPRLQLGLGRGHRLLGADRPGAAGEPLGPVELLLRPAELAATPLGQRRLPGLGDLAGPPQGRAADLVPGQVLDPLQRPGRVAGVQVGADLLGHPVGQAEPGRGQRVGRVPHPLGQVQVLDGPGQVVDRARGGSPGRSGPAPAGCGIAPHDGGPRRRGGSPGPMPPRTAPLARLPRPAATRSANVPTWLIRRPG